MAFALGGDEDIPSLDGLEERLTKSWYSLKRVTITGVGEGRTR